MNLIRKLLFPFSILYGIITSLRNFLFDKGILKSYSFDLPIIVVGNLSVGGTGKTPQIEYLIRLLSDKYKVATLSRGYKRKSKGFLLANASANAEILGDEPFQIHKKFPKILVAVDANRKNGIEQLISQTEKPQVILLDDAFQHRKVKAGFYILLTSYNDLFSDDFMLPTGNLRESRSGAKRADLIIVTKCPKTISELEQQKISDDLKCYLSENKKSQIYFSFIDYDQTIYSNTKQLKVEDSKKQTKLLVAGIAKPESFFNYLKTENDAILEYNDHHNFTNSDILTIKNKAQNNIIITTEKDYVRLNDKLQSDKLFYLPIKSSFINNSYTFDQTILDYVGTSSRNR
ncbi:tetraacyldisaccharide 4'-kinase [Flavobacterium sp.]|uniref:tetraacyldisaccharide 4'-kinase n=1 Tax=Flavobacterium sp. TaxID=239 RepID=UPI003751C4F0